MSEGFDQFNYWREPLLDLGDSEESANDSLSLVIDLDNKAPAVKEKSSVVEQMETVKENVPESNVNSFDLMNASKEASILETVQKNADVGAECPPIPEVRALSIRTFGVQTDVSGLNLDELDDPIVLKQINSDLRTELQESNDKFYRIQTQREVEIIEALETIESNLNETMSKSDRESTRKDEELKRIREALELEQHKNRLMQTNLENEQRLNFQLQSQLQSQREKETSMIKTLKLRFLKKEFDGKKALLMNKNLENEKLIGYLTNMNNNYNELTRTNFSAIKSSMDKLNEFTVKLLNSLETLQARYDEKVRLVEQSPGSLSCMELGFDTSCQVSPQLNSVEVDTLRLLASVNLNNTNRPPGALIADLPNMRRPSPYRPLSLLGPPPGLPPRSESGNLTADPLTTIRAANPSLRTVSSPRPAPAALARSAPPAGGAAAQAVGGAVGPSGPPTPAPAGPRNKSYQRLLTQLQGRYTDLSQPDAERYIHRLRESNNGKLSGMSIQSIFDRVGAFMRTDWRVESDTDNNCSICLEEMHDRDSRRLNPCEHKFHNTCIDAWLSSPGGASNTCPMCRHYIIQEEEFPDLGHRGHRRH